MPDALREHSQIAASATLLRERQANCVEEVCLLLLLKPYTPPPPLLPLRTATRRRRSREYATTPDYATKICFAIFAYARIFAATRHDIVYAACHAMLVCARLALIFRATRCATPPMLFTFIRRVRCYCYAIDLPKFSPPRRCRARRRDF